MEIVYGNAELALELVNIALEEPFSSSGDLTLPRYSVLGCNLEFSKCTNCAFLFVQFNFVILS